MELKYDPKKYGRASYGTRIGYKQKPLSAAQIATFLASRPALKKYVEQETYRSKPLTKVERGAELFF